VVIIIFLIGVYDTSPINCQVGAVFYIYFFLRALIRHNPKAWVTFSWVGIPGLRPYERVFVPDILSLGVFRPGWLWPKFDIDHASHVSFYISMGFHATTLFPKSVLMGLSSFAIWDKSKVIMAISVAIWVVNLGFQLKGKLISSTIPYESQRI
jgi:hypothetical protein